MKKLILLSVMICLTTSIFAQDYSLFQKKEFVGKDGKTLKYRVLYPKNYDKTKTYPLFVFLHGVGERGDNNESQLTHGATLFLDSLNREKHPAIVLFPQCPYDDAWAPMNYTVKGEREFVYQHKPNESAKLVKELLDDYRKHEAVDKNRIYIGGLSMGAMGTLDIVCRYPHYFAAASAICGGTDLSRLKRIKNMPLRLYHGKDDDRVSVEFSRMAFYTLKAIGGKVEYKEYENVKHNSWDNAFAEPDFLDWFFSMKK
jgi:predicted peptidase